MSNEAVIRVADLGKKYRIKHQAERQRYVALRDVLADKTKSVARRLWSAVRRPNLSVSAFQRSSLSPVEDFWALKNVSFDVKQGETLGIIGRNGAGKSTLLKILTRITEPTEGRVHIKGRVASLLEVGTGFHPELTGRENVFLNGAILGMTRAEIKKRFDEIVAFAEVEKFLDTPVKRYSSGMYVRLAFAVAAHLEPEILIVDEVLAVGDAQFQKKCLGKMESVARNQGRTILFVSHNMEAVSRLCTRALLLKAGSVVLKGETRQVVASYMRGEHGTSFHFRATSVPNDTASVARLVEVVVHGKDHVPSPSYSVREAVGVTMTYELRKDDVPLVDGFNVFNGEGTVLFVSHNVCHPNYNRVRTRGVYQSTAWIPADFLPEGVFLVSAALVSISPFQIHFHEEEAVSFQMFDPQNGSSARGSLSGLFPGVVRPLLKWDGNRVGDAPSVGFHQSQLQSGSRITA